MLYGRRKFCFFFLHRFLTISRYFRIQEANKCKTELQYWRSKSPATTVSNSFGHMLTVAPPDTLPIIVDIKADNLNLSAEIDKENPVQINENIVDLKSNKETDTNLAADSTLIEFVAPASIPPSSDGNHKWNHIELDKCPNDDEQIVDDVCSIGSPKAGDKRKMDDELIGGGCGGGSSTSAARSTNSNNGNSDIKKARRVQSKIRCQTKVSNNKTRSK